MEDQATDDARWPARTWILVATGGLCGLLIQLIVHDFGHGEYEPQAATVCLFLAGFAALLSFTLSRVRIGWSVAFSAVAASVPALAYYGAYGQGDMEPQRMLCALLAVGVALPIFLTVRDEGCWRLPYPRLHRHAWSSAVILLGAALFGGIVALLLLLWDGLFSLIGIDFFANLFSERWFIAITVGAVGAAGVSLLRDWSKVVGALQRMVMAVLAILAPVLGVALLLFLLALPIVGLDKLWGATDSTTPLLLSGMVFALLLVNSVLADSDADEARSRVLRAGAMALGLALLPLAALAAVSTGLRIDQHGLMPDRIWAAIFVGFALLYGLLYFAALVRRRGRWAGEVRRGNIVLACLIAGIALLLATPILDFQSISTRNQVARLLDGKVAPDKFDYAALKFDLDEPGKRALAKLRTLRDHPSAAAIRAQVADIDKHKHRWDMPDSHETKRFHENIARLAHILVRPQGTPIPTELRNLIVEGYDLYPCNQKDYRCVLLFAQLADDSKLEAALFQQECSDCVIQAIIYAENEMGWRKVDSSRMTDMANSNDSKTVMDAVLAGRFELRPRPRQDIYVDGKKVELPRF